MELFKIGFLDVRLLDIIDVILVALLVFQIYRLLKGSLAFNIFIGLLLVYLCWWLVDALEMKLLSKILGPIIGVGMIAILIVFQPEIRRFLLYLGRARVLNKNNPWKNLLLLKFNLSVDHKTHTEQIIQACKNLYQTKTGALIVFAKTSKLQFFTDTGVPIKSYISAELLESIFLKKSPLHDGAVIIAENKILAAKCILPVSDNPDLPSRIGTRHRAAVGITENSDAIAIIISEDKKQFAYAEGGKLYTNISLEKLENIIKKALISSF